MARQYLHSEPFHPVLFPDIPSIIGNFADLGVKLCRVLTLARHLSLVSLLFYLYTNPYEFVVELLADSDKASPVFAALFSSGNR